MNMFFFPCKQIVQQLLQTRAANTLFRNLHNTSACLHTTFMNQTMVKAEDDNTRSKIKKLRALGSNESDKEGSTSLKKEAVSNLAAKKANSDGIKEDFDANKVGIINKLINFHILDIAQLFQTEVSY